MAPLHGIGVLVTRPEQQATPLCRLLETLGASTIRLPAVEIKGIGERRDWSARAGALESYDLIIFTSTNAVRFGAALLDQKRDLALVAIGPATARTLNQAGYRVAVQPSSGYDSESLLIHPRLEHLAGHRILLIKGSGGRPLLEQELARRGAQVVPIDVYQRIAAVPSPEALADLQRSCAAGELHVITATSSEIAGNLLDFAPPDLRREFERIRWLVPSERVATHLRARGLTAPLLKAESAEDQDLAAALVRWRSSASGA